MKRNFFSPPDSKIEMPRKNKSTHFVFTSYLPSPPKYDAKFVRFLCYQLEKCPTTEKHHWQCAVEFYGEQTMRQAQRILEIGNTHIEFMRGTTRQAQDYCSKPESRVLGTYSSFGVDWTPNTNASGRGDRTDLKDATTAILSSGWRDVSDQSIVKFHRGLSFLRLVRTKSYVGPRECWWLHGDSGTNKTKYAVEYLTALNEGPIYWAPNTGGWFDGYDYEACILIDEFEKGQYTCSEILRITDRYPMKVKSKGGHEPFMGKYIFITSHHPPDYYFEADRIPEIERRIQVVKMGGV